jgi:hypothetical protein
MWLKWLGIVDFCYDTDISTFLSIRPVIINKSGASKFHHTIRILGNLPVEVYWYDTDIPTFLSILSVSITK